MTDLDTGKTVSLQELMVSTLKIQGDGREVTEVGKGKLLTGAISGELAGKIQISTRILSSVEKGC